MANKPVRSGFRIKKGSKINWILYIACIGLVFYIIIYLINQNVQITQSREQLQQLNNRIAIENIKLEELRDVATAVEKDDLNSFSDYVEKLVREDYGYVKSGEVVFINIAGQ